MNPLNDCQNIRGEFAALLDGELSSEERETVEQHLSECSECLRELDSLKRVDTLYQRLPPVSAPEHFEESVRASLRPRFLRLPRIEVPKFAVPRQWQGPAFAGLAVALVVLSFTVAWLHSTTGRRYEVADAETASEQTVALSRPNEEQTPSPAQGGPSVLSQAPEMEEAPAPNPAAGEDSVDGDSTLEKREFRADSRVARQSTPVPPSEPASPSADTRLSSPPPPEPQAQAEAAAKSGDVVEDRQPKAQSRATALAEPPLERGRGDESEGFSSAASLEKSEIAADGAGPSEDRMRRISPTTDSKTFEQRNGVWYETGYTGQPLRELAREGARMDTLLRFHSREVAQALQKEGRVIFQAGGIWYDLQPVRQQ